MAGLVPAIYVLDAKEDVDARHKAGHDECEASFRAYRKIPSFPCHFAALGLKARHVRGPRTPGGLPQYEARAA